jgi:ATP-binding cassette subfamily B protein
MIAKHYGRSYPLNYLREKSYLDRNGVSLKGISEAAELIGFRTISVKLPFSAEKGQPSLSVAPLPAIVHYNQNHFVVVFRISNQYVWIADPAHGKIKLKKEDFLKSWLKNAEEGFALLIEPTTNFYADSEVEETEQGFKFLTQYLKPHRKIMFQLIIGLFLGTVIQLIFPFLTQSLVDIGIDTKNLNFIYLVLAGQLVLFVSQTIVQFIQSWILLHISVRVNVNLVADFLLKMMSLPLSFFDAKNTGDLLQRISDHRRIETFLTQSSLTVLLSVMSLVVFGFVLAIYSLTIFLIFLGFSILYFLWVLIFLKKRRVVDYLAFQQLSDNQSSLIEIIQGIPEIKLQGSQLKHRWKWANIQAKLFRTQIKSLSITQYQDAGAMSINQLKDILITFFAATSVLDGSLTLGMMLAIQYIIGQLNVPLQQLVEFIRSAQDAKISLERLNEVHSVKNEEDPNEHKASEIPAGDIVLKNVSFSYTPISDMVLNDVSFEIPRGKTTAIVGTSGSGKTTLIKLLLGFYKPNMGKLTIGHQAIHSIYHKIWRAECGVVAQDGYIFSDSIAANIAESDDKIDVARVLKAAKIACIMDFIESQPQGLNTRIGAKGNGISQGQKQRILIARAVYKNSEFIFFDEATSSLDANNERQIMENLNEFFKHKTTVVVAHRLSTVKHADQIIVLHKGKVVETGHHEQLIEAKGEYYTLIKNQLELGS